MDRARSPLVLALVALTLVHADVAAQSDRSEAWRADLASLPERLEERHPNPYHSIPRAGFESALQRLHDRVADLEEHEIVVELARVMARIGDGHTGVFIPWDFDYGRYPLEIWSLEEGLMVAAAAEPELAGSRIVRIAGHPAETVLARADSLEPRDNQYDRRGVRRLLSVPEVLDALGIVDRADSLPLEVELASGEIHRFSVPAAPSDAEVDWRWGREKDELALWLRRRDARYWLRSLPEQRAVYVQYNDASWQDDEETLLAFGDRLVEHVESTDVERVIVDLRWNDGGSDRWTNILLHALIRIEHALGNPRTQDRNPGPPLFVLIGPETFSAATSFALDLEEHTNAVFVGEPTGGRPVGYGGQAFIELPRTGTRLRTSYRYQISSFPGDDREALFPHLATPPTIVAYRANRDPGLEAALGWTADQNVVARIRTALENEGSRAARAAWAEWREDPANRWVDPERDLNALGYQFLGQGRVEESIAVFRINAEAHPRSANAHDSLGEALARAGDRPAAIRAYERSLSLDPDGPLGANARQMLDELRSKN